MNDNLFIPLREFDPSGYYEKGGVASRDDDYIFNRRGEFTGKVIKRNAPHRLGMPDKDGKMQYYTFADQVNDPETINRFHVRGRGEKVKVVQYSKDDVLDTVFKQGGFNPAHSSSLRKFASNSTGGQRFDYTGRKLIPTYLKEDKGNLTMEDSDRIFFLPEGDGYAHNTHNFGNFLWALTGSANNYPSQLLRLGAQGNSLWNVEENGYYAQPDSDDDQFSIMRGIAFKNRNKDYIERQYPEVKGASKKLINFGKAYLNNSNYIVN